MLDGFQWDSRKAEENLRNEDLMSQETEDQKILPEYDFSNGERGTYATRFRENREALLESAAVLDREAWVAHSLRSFQALESYLVAYWVLALRHDIESAGRAVTALLHSCDHRPLKLLRRDMTKLTPVGEDFCNELVGLIKDRNWLVHKSFRSFSFSRVQAVADRSARLTEAFSALLLERCGQLGLDETEVQNRTEEIIKEWAADKDAA